MAKLLIFPLGFMLLLSFFGILFYNITPSESLYVDYEGNIVVDPNTGVEYEMGEGYYDQWGRLIAYDNWTLAVADTGATIQFGKGASPRYYFINSTDTYLLCDNASGVDSHDVLALAASGVRFSSLSMLLGNSMGFLALVGVVMALITVASLHILSSGLSETGVKSAAFGVFFIGLWLLVSAVPYTMMISLPLFGYLGYGVLSFVYMLGIMEVVGGG